MQSTPASATDLGNSTSLTTTKCGGGPPASKRCRDAKETVGWYEAMLGMTDTTAFAEDHVPATGEYDPYMRVFLDAGNGNIIAFFELPNQPDMGRDQNTPQWVQHQIGRAHV